MNAFKHAEISVKRRGGKIDDYYPIHFFIDSTKELCSDNRHRILHNLWGIRRIVIPIFGHTIINSDNKKVNVKDLCEQDHILPDYNNKFIPTIADFIQELDDLNEDEKKAINDIHQNYSFNTDELDLLLSPLQTSGELKSLLITHNSWFLNRILPKVFNRNWSINSFPIPSSTLFEKMNFANWMDNGRNGIPNSCKRIFKLL
jgi:hypothetical protein